MSDRLRTLTARFAEPGHAGNAITDLRDGIPPEVVARRRGMSLHMVQGVMSFHDHIGAELRVCDGTACHFEGAAEVLACADHHLRVNCLGMCHAAPALSQGDAVFAGLDRQALSRWLCDPTPDLSLTASAPPVARRTLDTPPVVLRNILSGPCLEVGDAYDLPDGEQILAAVEASGMRGRGGAAYPTAAKWRTARDTPAPDRYVVANGDEGDPGSFVDRILMEEDPHAILAGMLACGRVIGARKGIVYIRAEYPRARAVMLDAIHAARAAGKLGGDFDIEIYSGAGAYVCGEETALLRSIEGQRGEPQPKPPYPAQHGLYGLPTVVQNVETLAVIPWLVREGRNNRTTGSGNKALSLSGAINQPGLVEIPLGVSLRRVLEVAGEGAPIGRRWRMAVVGGPMGRVLPVSHFDTALSYSALPGLGHGGIVVLDDTVRASDVAAHLFSFARSESCGTCTPCRVGTARLADQRTRAGLERLMDTMELGSLCGFGQGVPRPIRDLLQFYGDEVFSC